MSLQTDLPSFFASPPHACSYLPGKQAVTLVADPQAVIQPGVYAELIDYGFRRSGNYLYRPRCPDCEACVPVRIPAARFAPHRRHRRTWRRNADLRVMATPAGYREEQFTLYRRYVRSRHPNGGMDEADPRRYLEFLTADWCDTVFYEFRDGRRLLAVAVADLLPQGLSAVYTFFDPDEKARSLGVHAVLWEIVETQRRRRAWVYLGYWIRECQKMSYKADYRPLQMFRHGRWVEVAHAKAPAPA